MPTADLAAGSWQHEDYDVFDGDHDVGRIYRLNAATEQWRWGASFELTGRKSYGTADTREQAIAAPRRTLGTTILQ